MTCKVRIASPLRSYTMGEAMVSAEGATVREVLAHLEHRFPGMRFRMIDEQDRVRRHVRFFVNTTEVKTLSDPVREGDEMHLVCALSGG
ncbi:MAG: MoaD/ThiS family protein [Lysobacterales bacterium]|nr:MAG: MoaD/ThiS family protein [Xanthomonadales bacterium]